MPLAFTQEDFLVKIELIKTSPEQSVLERGKI